MARFTRKSWLKTAVIGFGIADCIGIYAVQQHLAQPAAVDYEDSFVAQAYAQPDYLAADESRLLGRTAPSRPELDQAGAVVPETRHADALAAAAPSEHHHDDGALVSAKELARVERDLARPTPASTAGKRGSLDTARSDVVVPSTRLAAANPAKRAIPSRSVLNDSGTTRRVSASFRRAFSEMPAPQLGSGPEVYEPVIAAAEAHDDVSSTPVSTATSRDIPAPAFGTTLLNSTSEPGAAPSEQEAVRSLPATDAAHETSGELPPLAG